MSGTYTFDDKEKTITMKGKLGVKNCCSCHCDRK